MGRHHLSPPLMQRHRWDNPMTALHCQSCDTWGCPGFLRPATPEPLPAPRPERVATEAQRRAAIDIAAAGIAAARRKTEEGR